MSNQLAMDNRLRNAWVLWCVGAGASALMLWTAEDGGTQGAMLAAMGLITLGLVVEIGKARNGRPCGTAARHRGTASHDVLDDVLFHWTPKDPKESKALFSVRDLLGGIIVFGAIGKGKTSGSSMTLGRSILAHPKSGGLILCAKPGEDIEMWRRLFAEAGRSDDLRVFSPKSGLGFNCLDYACQAGADARGLCKLLTTVGELLRPTGQRSGEGEFFAKETEREVYLAIVVVRLAEGKVSAPVLQAFIQNAARDPAQIADEKWKEGFHNHLLRKAHANVTTRSDKFDLQAATAYFTIELPSMAPRTRSGIEIGSMGLLHVLISGQARLMFSEETNITPDEMKDGRWVGVDMSPAEYGDLGLLASGIWKYSTQQMVLRRQVKPGDGFVVIHCDEFHLFLNSFDVDALTQMRSHLGCQVVLTQSTHNLFAALAGGKDDHQAKALLALFGHRIFHAGNSYEDAEFAANLIGKERQMFFSGNSQVPNNMFDAMTGQSQQSNGFSENLDYRIAPDRFLNGLRCGGPANGGIVDAIVVKSGEPFSSGRNFMIATFQQR